MGERSYRILIVDDSPEDRELYRRRIVESCERKYVFRETESGEEGLQLCRVDRPHCILLDYSLPDLDGLEFLARLRAEQGETAFPVVMLTGQGNETVAVRAMKAGAQDYLVKGRVTGDSLCHAVQTAMEKVALRQRIETQRRELLIRARQQEGIARFSLLAQEDTDLPRLFDRAVTLVAQSLRVEYVGLLELLSQGHSLLLRAGLGWKEGYVGQATVGAGLDSEAGYTLLSSTIINVEGRPSHQPVIVKDLARETRFHRSSLLRDHGVVSNMSVIVSGSDGPFGVLGVHTAWQRTFTAEEVYFLQTVANVLSSAVRRCRLQEALHQRVEELAEAARRKDEFLAMLAHELRNPLAPIRYAVQILRHSSGDAAVLEQTRDVMERQIQHMARLIDDLLDVSRISRGKVQLRKEHLNLATVVGSVVESTRALLKVHQHQLTVSLPSEAVWMEADPVRLEQVLVNLVNNAAKFTEDGGHIWLTVERQEDRAILRVRDTGAGIAPEILPQIFDPFRQADTSLARTKGGLGLGLTLVRGLVEMHGGTVQAFSAGLGQGSEFPGESAGLAYRARGTRPGDPGPNQHSPSIPACLGG